MSGHSTLILSAEKEQVLTGIQVMILSDVEVSEPWIDEPIELAELSYPNQYKKFHLITETIPSVISEEGFHTKLGQLLVTICLKYPFWNNFRILDFFNKRGIEITMEELLNLRAECGIKSKEDVCRELMRLHFNDEIELDKRQVQFIERLNPIFRDRNFLASGPGDVLVYECVFFRRLNKMFYLHLVLDLFNGYAFGKMSRRCSGEIGLRLLQEKIVPFYRSRGYTIHKLVHSIKATREHCEEEESMIRESVLAMGIEWLEPRHEFGIIQRFQRDFLEDFFSDAEALDISLAMIQPALNRWIIKYNGTSPFHRRRNLFGYVEEFSEMTMRDLESRCN
ncbi:hypothetical protein [Pelosinus sp. sgz500959]|uniref:hypothetical protein n=1 Tax=Pelosinus sp. sgz500959 TaxID=3242472 RepID=UPI003670C8FB